MIAAIMYAGIGFLSAGLITLVVIPLVHGRAVRLTTRQLKAVLPQSMAEIHAGKDQLRATFAVSTRRLERENERLKEKAGGYIAELATKSDLIKELTAERNALQVEIGALNARVEAVTVGSNQIIDRLKTEAERYLNEVGARGLVIDKLEMERNALRARIGALNARVEALAAGGNEVRIEPRVQIEVLPDWSNADVATMPADSVYGLTRSDDGDGVAASFDPKVWPTAGLSRVPTEVRPPKDRRHRFDAVAVMPEWPKVETVDEPSDASPPAFDQQSEDSVANLVPESPTAETADARADAAPPPAADQQGEGVAANLVPQAPPTENADAPGDAPQPPTTDQQDEDSVANLVPESPTAETAEAPGDAAPPPPFDQQGEDTIAKPVPRLTAAPERAPTAGVQSPSPGDWHHLDDLFARLSTGLKADTALSGGPDAKRGGRGFDWERPDFLYEREAAEPTIRVPPRDEFADNKRLSREPALTGYLVAVLIGAGASVAWHNYGDEATDIIKKQVGSLDLLSSGSTMLSAEVESPASQTAAAGAGEDTAPAPATASPFELVQRGWRSVLSDHSALPQGVEDDTAEQQPAARNITTRRLAEPPAKSTASLPLLQRPAIRTPMPETKPITIAGWTLLEVTRNSVVLEGPNGVWRATRGTMVPGVGRVESVVRWGDRWIVATSTGLISTR